MSILKFVLISWFVFAIIISPLNIVSAQTTTSTSSVAEIRSLLEQLVILIKALIQLRLETVNPGSNISPLPFSQSGNYLGGTGSGSGSNTSGGSGASGGLGGSLSDGLLTNILTTLFMSSNASFFANNQEWFGTYDTSAKDFPVPGVTQQGTGDPYKYDLGTKAPTVPGKSSPDGQRIYDEAFQAASGAKPLTTSQYDRLGCAYAVATVLERAGLSVGVPEKLAYTPDLKRALDQAKGKYNLVGQGTNALTAAIPGDVVISPTAGGRTGHTGICMTARCDKIASNSSSKKRFIVNYTNLYWMGRFGNNTYVYRAGPVDAPVTSNTSTTDPAKATTGGSLGNLSAVADTREMRYLYSPQEFVCAPCLTKEQELLSQGYNVKVVKINAATTASLGITSYPYVSNRDLLAN